MVSRYQAIEFKDFRSDRYEPYRNSLARDWVKCSSVDSAPEEAVTFEVDEYWGFTGFIDGEGGVVGRFAIDGDVV